MDEYSKPGRARGESITADDPAAAVVVDVDGDADAISEAELREFLAADAFGASADPAFKRRLKGRLWEVVEARLQSKLRDKWTAGWRRRDVPSTGDTSVDAKRER